MMGFYNGKISKKAVVTAVAACVLLAAAAVTLFFAFGSEDESVVTEDVAVERRNISQSVTAAGEVVAADSEEIAFSTSKYFKAMCVELNEEVSEGQHLIMYSNGTYEDAPADGFITAINAPSTGSMAGSGNSVTFARADKLEVDITVPEGEINEVSEGDSAEIVVNSDTSKVYTGKITAMKAISTTLMGSGSQSGTSGNRQSGGASPFGSESSVAYYTVSLTFNNDGTVLPGMSAICTVTISEKNDVITVPIEAVSFDDEGNAYVKVVSDGSLSEQQVAIGDSDAEYVEITEGLEGTETVRIERKGKS